MRGKLATAAVTAAAARITPAGAGKTLNVPVVPRKLGDHPRRCGGNHPLCTLAGNIMGSPPQVRGKPYPAAFNSEAQGITPAGAGKTRLPARTANSLRDHPRRCGENTLPEADLAGRAGSPPQVRGKLSTKPKFKNTIRITPAGAGKT